MNFVMDWASSDFGPVDHDHLSVGATQYTGTFLYYLSIVGSLMYLIYEPVALITLLAIKQFTYISPLQILWTLLSWFLSIYALVLDVASGDIQAFFLFPTYYIKGFSLTMLLVNLFQVLITYYYWISVSELGGSSVSSVNAYNQAMWNFLYTFPRLLFLLVFYLFYTEINLHFTENTATTDPTGIY